MIGDFAPSLLLASPGLEDPLFSRKAVLMVEYDEEGALGFVVNAPSELTLEEVIANPMEINQEHPVWNGGPVESDTAYILHNAGGMPCTRQLVDGLMLSSDSRCLDGLLQKQEAFRFIIGYAGWGPGQLEQELREGTWLQAPLIPERLFQDNMDSFWQQSLMTLGQSHHNVVAPQAADWLN